MPKLKAGTLVPAAGEDAAIAADIAQDPDTLELSRAEMPRMRPLRGGPPVARPKESLTMRLYADVPGDLEATSPGWQTRVNERLKQAVRRGRI
jgi:uncharacterized protein (DUF4415 family)